MSTKITEIGGLPIERWVGRKMNVENSGRRGGKSSTKGKLLELVSGGRKAIIKVDNHPGTVTEPVDRLSPWWAGNPDLHEEAERLKEEAQAAETSETAEASEPPQQETTLANAATQTEMSTSQIREILQNEMTRIRGFRFNIGFGDAMESRDKMFAQMTKALAAVEGAEIMLQDLDNAIKNIDDAVESMGNWVIDPSNQ